MSEATHTGTGPADGPGLRQVRLPAAGVVRAHPDPGALPRFPGPGEVPRNRFDDPAGEFRVRYAATTVRGAFLEVLAGFRSNGPVEARLAAVTGVVGQQRLEPAGAVPAGLLDRLRIARLGARSVAAWFVDVAAVETQTLLGGMPAVVAALAASGLGTSDRPVQLDAGTIGLAGPVGRAITQVVARVVFTDTDAGGLRYTSRVDATEECWAIFDTVPVWAAEAQPVAADDPDLRAACAALGLQLPT